MTREPVPPSGAERPDPAAAAASDPQQPGRTPVDDRLASLLSVDIGEVPAARRRRERARPPGEPAETEPPAELAPEPSLGERRSVHAVMWAALAVLFVSGVGLAYAGAQIVRNSTEGQVVAPIADPDEPGFEALVDPTPTLLVLHDLDGTLDAVAVLTLPDPEGTGGGVVLVPTRTIYDMPLYEVNPIELAYDLGSPDFTNDVVGQLLDTGLGNTLVVDAARWAELVAPVAPITVENSDEIRVDGDVVFPVGEVELAAEDVGPYLEARVEGESDLARLFRHQTFWQAWLDAIAASGRPEAVPGEVDSGIGRFVRAIAAGSSVIDTIPVQPATPGRYGDEPAFVPRFSELRELIDRVVPFPVASSPGSRARVRVLNGTDDTDTASQVAGLLPPAGVQVVIVGNALEFGQAQTVISYAGDAFVDEAESIRSILGVGELVVETRPSDAADITVTLGADYG